MRKWLWLIGLTWLFIMMAAAAYSYDTTAANYLKIGLSAKAVALGR